jgi:hypothetical protein
MLTLFITFLILLLISGIFIVAIYNLTRHYIEIQPDGTHKVKGFILKWWSYFIETETGVKTMIFTGEQRDFKIADLKYKLPNLFSKIKELTNEDIDKIERVLLCKIDYTGNDLVFFIEEPIYLLPEWVRKPLSQCVTCMASFWGTLLWVGFNYVFACPFFRGFHPCATFFLFYVVFIVVLSQITNILFKKTSKYV